MSNATIDGKSVPIPKGWHRVKAGAIREGDRIYTEHGPSLFTDELYRGSWAIGRRVKSKRLVIRRDRAI